MTVSSDRSLRSFGQVFDSCAPAYDEVRRSYPPVLVDAAIERGGLVPGSRVLEVGCGTGKLTELLAGRGLVVDAVDPGPNMIEVARKRVGETDRVRFHVGRFEELPLDGRRSTVSSRPPRFTGSSPEIGWRKVARHLKPGGLFGLPGTRRHSRCGQGRGRGGLPRRARETRARGCRQCAGRRVISRRCSPASRSGAATSRRSGTG